MMSKMKRLEAQEAELKANGQDYEAQLVRGQIENLKEAQAKQDALMSLPATYYTEPAGHEQHVINGIDCDCDVHMYVGGKKAY